MPSSPVQIVLVLGMNCLFFGMVPLLLFFVLVYPGFKARKAMAELNARLCLAPISLVNFDAEFGLETRWGLGMSTAVAAGQRNGLRVALMLQAGRSRAVGEYTLAAVAWPDPRGSKVGLKRGEPLLSSLFGSTKLTGPLGDVEGWGEPGEVARVFPPRIQALLASFPRRVELAGADRNAVYFTWSGVESDAGLCEYAWSVAAEIARSRSSAYPNLV